MSNSKSNKILILSGKDVRKVLSMSDCIDAMQGVFKLLGEGGVEIPLRTAVNLESEEGNGTALFMPSYLPNINKVGIKAVNVHKGNTAKGLPMNQGLVMIFDSVTGSPLALMDGNTITSMRTGAISGLATKYMAREDAKVVSLIGTGVQGATQLEAMCAVRDIEKIYVFDRNPESAEKFAVKMQEQLGLSVVVGSYPDDLSKADIICTATPATSPVFADNVLPKGVHINSVGAFTFDMCEISIETILRSKVVVDEMHAALSEAGDLMQPIAKGIITKDHIFAELGDLATGKKQGRATEDETTWFKTVGVAVQDLATADAILTKAREMGVGVEVEM